MRIAFLLATMPIIWAGSTANGTPFKLYQNGRKVTAKVGTATPTTVVAGEPGRMRLCEALGLPILPADLLTALQESQPSASSSEAANPIESTAVRACQQTPVEPTA